MNFADRSAGSKSMIAYTTVFVAVLSEKNVTCFSQNATL